MTEKQSSVVLENICCSTPIMLEEAIKLVARLREHGAKVINRKGEDMTEADIEALVNRLNGRRDAEAGR
jgi:hypothetical protein